MFNDDEGCYLALVQLIFIGIIAFIVGLGISFYVNSKGIGLKYSHEFIQRLDQKTKETIVQANQLRKRFFLLPNELNNLRHRLSVEKQAFQREKGFNQALIKQVQDNDPYIVVSLADNILYLKRKDKIMRKATVATGKNKRVILRGRTYEFFTPRTIFTIKKKILDPTWIMPNWAFHELGQQPPSDFKKRYKKGVLGKFALVLGGGYMIHGTLDRSSLGKYVTHGCVRVGDRDLKALYNAVDPGTKVYIY